jgi:DNA-binding beta-propeller fold protein YncE
MIWVSDDLKRLITSNVSSATMTIIDKSAGGGGRGPGRGAPGGDWEETVVPVGRGAEGFDVAPGEKELWAANAQDGTISILDLAGKRVSDTLEVSVKGANRLKFTPDGKLVLVSTLGGPELTILDAATRKVVKRVKIGSGAAGIEMNPDGSRAYVACTPDNYVVVVDLKKLDVTEHFDAGKQPDGMAWAALR